MRFPIILMENIRIRRKAHINSYKIIEEESMIKKARAHMTLDISILNKAKKNAQKRGWPLSRYVNSVLREYFAQTENAQRKEMESHDAAQN